MIGLKIVTVCFLAVVVQAEKKIELQDIEEDNLRNEKQKNYDKSDSTQQTSSSGSSQGLVPLEFLKNGLLRYFENPKATPQPQRYVHQYAVTEQPETSLPVSESQYTSPAPQQAMVGYLSNVPMQIYLVPQYYSEQSEQPTQSHVNTQYQQFAGAARVPTYQKGHDTVQKQIQLQTGTKTNYVQEGTYTPPTSQPYVQQYSPSISYLGFPPQPTNAPLQVTVTPAVPYLVPVAQYTSAIIQPTTAPKTYYQNPPYPETNSVNDIQGPEFNPRQYSSQSEISYHKTPAEYPRHYNSRAPYRDDYRGHSNTITELPRPNPILLKAPPSHLAHIPKVLPMHRPFTKPVYQTSGTSHSSFTPSHEAYIPPHFKRRPTSLLDSYIPSNIQVEYLKRGLFKDPLVLYDALASLSHPVPRHYEKGFLPNQLYHTAAGGITFGHQKRTPKSDKIPYQ